MRMKSFCGLADLDAKQKPSMLVKAPKDWPFPYVDQETARELRKNRRADLEKKKARFNQLPKALL